MIEKLAIQLGQQLHQRDWKVVTAESCTGGGLAYWITSVPGSSTWFERGFVTYSNTAKEELLGVNIDTLNQFGAVSKQTALEMATGALKHSSAQISVAITGIAGPDGGTGDKPVGTVYIAVASRDTEPHVEQNMFAGDREAIRTKSIERALTNILKLIA